MAREAAPPSRLSPFAAKLGSGLVAPVDVLVADGLVLGYVRGEVLVGAYAGLSVGALVLVGESAQVLGGRRFLGLAVDVGDAAVLRRLAVLEARVLQEPLVRQVLSGVAAGAGLELQELAGLVVHGVELAHQRLLAAPAITDHDGLAVLVLDGDLFLAEPVLADQAEIVDHLRLEGRAALVVVVRHDVAALEPLRERLVLRVRVVQVALVPGEDALLAVLRVGAVGLVELRQELGALRRLFAGGVLGVSGQREAVEALPGRVVGVGVPVARGADLQASVPRQAAGARPGTGDAREAVAALPLGRVREVVVQPRQTGQRQNARRG